MLWDDRVGEPGSISNSYGAHMFCTPRTMSIVNDDDGGQIIWDDRGGDHQIVRDPRVQGTPSLTSIMNKDERIENKVGSADGSYIEVCQLWLKYQTERDL